MNKDDVYSTENKVRTLEELIPLVDKIKRGGKRIVTTNGCFDILHPGHVESFEWARAQGDALIIGTNSDRSVRAIKGEKRPIIDENNRARMLAGLAAIDYVFIFDEESPISWIKKFAPHVHVKGQGSELSPAFAGEKAVIEECGGEVRLAPQKPGLSTTKIIETVLLRYQK